MCALLLVFHCCLFVFFFILLPPYPLVRFQSRVPTFRVYVCSQPNIFFLFSILQAHSSLAHVFPLYSCLIWTEKCWLFIIYCFCCTVAASTFSSGCTHNNIVVVVTTVLAFLNCAINTYAVYLCMFTELPECYGCLSNPRPYQSYLKSRMPDSSTSTNISTFLQFEFYLNSNNFHTI